MKGMTIEEIAKSCGGVLTAPDFPADREIGPFVTDSRQAAQGGAYAAIKGARVDGHSFIGDVYEKGALLCVGEDDYTPPAGKAYIKVHSTVEALGRIACEYMRKLDIPVVGITGSVGKTSTKEVIASVLSAKYKTGKTRGNHNNDIGLPITCLELEGDTQVAVLEMGISAPGEMDYLTKIVQPTVGVITNIGVAHMEILGSRDGIFEEKRKIINDLPENGLAVLCGDDDILPRVKEAAGIKPVFFGLEKNGVNDLYAGDIKELGLDGTEFTIMGLKDHPEGVRVTMPIPGKHMVLNALAAAAVGQHLGLDADRIKTGLSKASTIAGRTDISINEKRNIHIIDDSYNASPASMKSSIDTLSLAKGRKICVLGNMYELGEGSEKMHYDVGRYAADKGVNVLFTCGELAKDIARGALNISMSADLDAGLEDECAEIMMTDPEANVVPLFFVFDDKEAMINKLSEFVKPGDAVLVKASNSMGFSGVVDALKNLV